MTSNLRLEGAAGAPLSDGTSELGELRAGKPLPLLYPKSTTNNRLAKKNIFAQQAKAGLERPAAFLSPRRETAGVLSEDLEAKPSDRIRGEVRTELISQFTSKMSETAISQRKLE